MAAVQSILIIAAIIMAMVFIGRAADRWGTLPGPSDSTIPFLVFMALPWGGLIVWFIYIDKWNGVLFIVLLLASTFLGAFIGYQGSKWTYLDPYMCMIVGGWMSFMASGTVLAQIIL